MMKMRFLVMLMVAALLHVSCSNTPKASANENTASVTTTPSMPQEEFLPDLPTLELSYFALNKDGSGMAGVPKPVKVQQPPTGMLYSYPYFEAHVIPRKEGPGEDINVYQPNTGGMAYMGGGEAVYYRGIYNQYLLLDVGSSASRRELMIINMITGDTTYRAEKHSDFAAMYGQYVVHLSPDREGKTCTTAAGQAGQAYRAIWVNPDNKQTKVSAQRECLYVE
jgi:ABC-type Zn uptake system ZnuABC Zn-binding protein ZnuA